MSVCFSVHNKLKSFIHQENTCWWTIMLISGHLAEEAPQSGQTPCRVKCEPCFGNKGDTHSSQWVIHCIEWHSTERTHTLPQWACENQTAPCAFLSPLGKGQFTIRERKPVLQKSRRPEVYTAVVLVWLVLLGQTSCPKETWGRKGVFCLIPSSPSSGEPRQELKQRHGGTLLIGLLSLACSATLLNSRDLPA